MTETGTGDQTKPVTIYLFVGSSSKFSVTHKDGLVKEKRETMFLSYRVYLQQEIGPRVLIFYTPRARLGDGWKSVVLRSRFYSLTTTLDDFISSKQYVVLNRLHVLCNT